MMLSKRRDDTCLERAASQLQTKRRAGEHDAQGGKAIGDSAGDGRTDQRGSMFQPRAPTPRADTEPTIFQQRRNEWGGHAEALYIAT